MKRPTINNGVQVPDDKEVGELVARLHPPGPEAWAACLALGHSESRKALDVLSNLLKDPDWRYRRSAVEAVAEHPFAASISGQIIKVLRDPSPYVVRTACNSVMKLKLNEAHDQVLGLISSPDSYTRETAISALSSIWKPTDFDLVFKIFSKDHSTSVRKEAGYCLKTNVSKENWRQLFTACICDEIPRHRTWACDLASQFGDETDKLLLTQLLDDPDGHVRKAVARLLQ